MLRDLAGILAEWMSRDLDRKWMNMGFGMEIDD